MKEDGELGVSDDKESIITFRILVPKLLSKSCRGSWGWKKNKVHKKGQSSFLRRQFVCVYKDILVYEDEFCLQTSASTATVHN